MKGAGTTGERHVVVVGGGITGLAAAHALTSRADAPRVTVLEAGEHLGGKIRTSPFAGLAAIDEGADAFLARVPWATELAQQLDLGEQLTSPQSGRAAVWWDELHDIPDGLLLGMPTKLLGLSRSRLLTWSGKLRAATEPLRRRTSLDTDSIGAFVRARFGNEVHFRLVDPLIGSIYAADTDYFSLAAVPQIADLARRSRSVLLAARHRGAPPVGPVFYAPSNGMAAMVDAGSAAIRSAGGSILTARPVGSIAPDGAGWRVDGDHADAVIMCCPAAVTARLIAPFAPEPAVALAAIPTADVALLTITVAASEWPERLLGRSGYLVPKPRQRLVTAVSFGSQKWAHWQVDGKVVLRISLGRDGLPVLHLDDEQLLAAAVADTSRHLGFQVRPIDVRLSRFPGAFPQYRPHHADRVTAAEAMLPTGLELAGASFHGIGIPACVRSATGAAARVSEYFDRLAHLA